MKRPRSAGPMPTARAPLPMTFTCSDAQFERLVQGHAADDMNDPWYAFYEAPWLYVVHIAGAWAYGMRFERDGDLRRGVEAWVTRDAEGLDRFGYKLAWEDLEGNALYLQILLSYFATGKVALDLHERLAARQRLMLERSRARDAGS